MQQSDRTVYVGNVGKEVDESALLALFGHCGTVCALRIAVALAKRSCTVHQLCGCTHLMFFCGFSLQVTQIRIAGEPSYDTRYAFIEFSTPEEVGHLTVSAFAF